MKEIKEIRTIEEVVGYEAFDGTKFVDKTECEKYEKMTAEEAIKKNFAKLVVAMAEEDDDITKANTPHTEEFIGAGVGEGYGLALVRIKDENDVNICNAYKKLVCPKYGKEFTNDMIGKDIIVGVTYDYYEGNREDGNWEYENCWVFGTIEYQIALYASRLKEAFKVEKGD